MSYGITPHSGIGVLAALTPAAGKLPKYTGASTAETIDITSFIETLLDDADAATARGTLSAQTQGDVLDDLNILGASGGDGEFLVATGAGALAWESGADARDSLSLGQSASPQFTSLTLSGQSGSLSMNSQKITNLATPTSGTDAATKAYADSIASGLSDWKDSVRAWADQTNLDAYTQAGAGVGATLTANANGALASQDGISLTAGDRILVAGATHADCGIYTVTDLGDGSNPWVLTRATDADSDAEVTSAMYVFVSEGGTYGGTAWVLATSDDITVDTTALNFVQFSSAESLVPGDGLSKSGNTLAVDVSDIAGTGLEDDGSENLRISTAAAGDGLTGGGGSALAIDFALNPGLEINGAQLRIKAHNGVDLSANGLAVDLATNPGLEFSSGQLRVKPNGAVIVDVNGVGISYAPNEGVQDIGNGVGLKLNGATLNISSSGVKVSDGGIDTAQLAADAVDNTILDLTGDYALTGVLGTAARDLAVALQSASSLTLDDTHDVVSCDPTTQAITINLPAATGSGRRYTVKHGSSSGNSVTVDAGSGKTIDGAQTKVLSSSESITVCDVNTNAWAII